MVTERLDERVRVRVIGCYRAGLGVDGTFVEHSLKLE